jgi:hypothetical protein
MGEIVITEQILELFRKNNIFFGTNNSIRIGNKLNVLPYGGGVQKLSRMPGFLAAVRYLPSGASHIPGSPSPRRW